MTNNNVLHGVRCPKCKSEGPFDIYGSALFRNVGDDGVSEFTDFEWDNEAPFYCHACKHSGRAKEFNTK